MLTGERVRLEPLTPRLATAVQLGRADEDLPWERGFPLVTFLDAAAKVTAADAAGQWLGPFFAYVIVRRADGLAVGDAGFHGPPGTPGEVEVGYTLVPDARGAGLARAAVGLLIEWAGAQPGVRHIVARVDEGNVRSIHLLHALGFVADGTRGGLRRFVLRDASPGT